ncbi:hypothetical protein [Streptomyces sp. NPDC056399]|uniref:hypothetical protein n=1 Tax=Streptomyces sp. NPDC056399 TaxID=3345807 RepID=UPI0035D67D39
MTNAVVTASQLAADARVTHRTYAAFLHRDPSELIDRLDEMCDYAALRSSEQPWGVALQRLTRALRALSPAPARPTASSRAEHQAATTAALNAIVAFEEADAVTVTLPHDEHSRYVPAPGTEYPFHVSDIGRAAVQLLGSHWHAESSSFGVGAHLTRMGSVRGFYLGVDEEGDLFLEDQDDSNRRSHFLYCSAADGLLPLAHRVADRIREIREMRLLSAAA